MFDTHHQPFMLERMIFFLVASVKTVESFKDFIMLGNQRSETDRIVRWGWK